MSEHEGGFDDRADLSRTGSEVPQGTPPSSKDGEAAFAQATQATEQGVIGTGVHVEHLITGRLFDRGVHADAGPLVATISQCRQIEWEAAQYRAPRS
jgi:hypothetical protein